uniref:CHAD domain-containing protein n=1 Tax=Candidatus Electronema sp. TaxID=2698783 RepID=UPI004055F53C
MKKNKLSPYFFLPLPETGLLEEIKICLEVSCRLNGLPSRPSRTVFFDSFDWRLWQHGLICCIEDGLLHLTDFSGRPAVAALPCHDAPPRFWRDLPESEFRQKLADMLQHRALLPQAELSGTVTVLHLLAKKEKNAAVVLLADAGPKCCFAELRGGSRKLRRMLEKFGATQHEAARQRLEAALAAAGRTPADYSASFSIELEPDMDSRTAAKRICRRLLATLRQNEQGVAEDIDIEFLHDFRVTARRVRSVFALLGDALEPETRSRFSAAFKELGQMSGVVRDLDVQLLAAAESRARLPEMLHDGLDSLFAELTAKRAVAQQEELAVWLAAPQQQEMLQAWEEYLGQEDAEGSGRCIGAAAGKIIRRQFARLLEAGRAIDSQSSDQDLHRMRIHSKKLRYALEFFRSLYAEKDVERLITPLKHLQDMLGLNNDLAVQEETLTRHLAALETEGAKTEKMAAAIGGLLTSFRRSREELRGCLLETLRQFCADTEKLRLRRRKG